MPPTSTDRIRGRTYGACARFAAHTRARSGPPAASPAPAHGSARPRKCPGDAASRSPPARCVSPAPGVRAKAGCDRRPRREGGCGWTGPRTGRYNRKLSRCQVAMLGCEPFTRSGCFPSHVDLDAALAVRRVARTTITVAPTGRRRGRPELEPRVEHQLRVVEAQRQLPIACTTRLGTSPECRRRASKRGLHGLVIISVVQNCGMWIMIQFIPYIILVLSSRATSGE